MLSTVTVALSILLMELCSSSPVYNMQPAFITNTLGATTGRNIRNLPCISRKNNNLHGVCMFAIDCVKSNGTHLGTCIDRFYFGSCCLVEPVHDIVENTIESDIIPHREPPLRLSNITTTSTTMSSTKFDEIETSSTPHTSLNITSTTTTTEKISLNSTVKLELYEQMTKMPSLSDYKVPENTTLTFRPSSEESITRKPSVTTEVTTTPQKLQTFFAVDGSTLEDGTTKSTNKIIITTPRTTKTSTTIKPISTTAQTKPSSIKPVQSKPSNRPTLKPKPVRTSATTVQPTKASRPPSTKTSQKPTKSTTKPVRRPTTKKPIQIQTTKTPTTTKPTRRPFTTAKPTKKVTSTTTIKTTTTTATKQPPPTSTSKPLNVTSVPSNITYKPEDVTKKDQLIQTTTVSNEIPVNKINVSQILETVNGNPATNEIEAGKPIEPLVTTRPGIKPSGLVTWTVADDKLHTEPSTTEATNITVAEWMPITTPDVWVLLPSVKPNITQLEDTTSSPSTEHNATRISNVTISTLPYLTTTPILPSTESFLTTTPKTSTSTTTSTTTTTTTTTLPTISEEKPSVTNIPSETTTQSALYSQENATTTGLPLTTGTPEIMTEETTLTPIRPVNMSDFTDVCGRRMYPEARIVGGEKSAYGRWPWQISLRQWRTSTYLHKCGAALLNENWAITAAHCVDQVPPSELLLRLGEHDLSTESEPYLHQERRVQIVASHPQFDPRTFEYDLALLRFYEPVTFQPNILPVCVPQTDDNFIGRTAYVTGWGRLYENGPLPSILQEVSVPVINNTVCEGMYKFAGYIEHIPHIFICAGWRRGGFDSCEGDSGGPMVIQREDKRFLLAGVISWGIGCAEPNQPGVYTRISEFREWINQILQF